MRIRYLLLAVIFVVISVTIPASPDVYGATIWPGTAVPGIVDSGPDSAVELGLKFRSDSNGVITGIRFYKASANTGSHVANLWTSSGALLATATFANETASGWQQVDFATSVAITANTVYIASYHTSSGHYSVDQNFFLAKSVDAPPLHALADGVSGVNGVYAYGTGSSFPTLGWRSSNYWVDVVLSSTPPTTVPPPIVSTGYTLWPGTTIPGVVDAGPDSAVELGVKFRSDSNGTITGIRFYKAGANTGSHVGSLWTSSGALLATATFANESGSGWQQVDFATPVAISANTVYLASYHTDSGHYSFGKGYFAGSAVDSPPLHALADGVSGANGVFAYGGVGSFPYQSWNSSNYWVDVVFRPSISSVPPPTSGTNPPILLITSAANPFSLYYAEIFRNEGFNAFDVSDISGLSSAQLAAYDLAVLGEVSLTQSQVTTLTNWVNAGGKLIAMRPDKKLAALLGLSDLGSTLTNAYLLVNTSFGPGVGIVDQTIQFHGPADRYTLNGAISLATLYASSVAATSSPAATLRNVGSNGGQVAAFSYDLARSIVYTRQGNPNWSGQERDSFVPIRTDDLYYGAASFDPQSDWVDLNKVAIPQADEQQRLLANLIVRMNMDKKPLPRFWYFPRSLPAVVVMTGDDHGNNGTAGRFDSYLAASSINCSVDNWECIRATSYIYIDTPLTNAQAAAYNSAGFEVGLHVSTNCADWSTALLESFYATQLGAWGAKYGSLPAPSTNRTHCTVWSDYATQAAVEQAHGIRLDANYYYWPSSWVNDNPGFFTGSGLPMRFAGSSGTLIDVYQATTQMTDESGQSYPATINILLDRAIGPLGYYGAFVVNAHTDQTASSVSDAVVVSATARGIPVVSSRQLLKWLDGRNGSTFNALAWNGSTLSFTIASASGASGLVAMLPMLDGLTVTAVSRNGTAVPFTTATLKGIPYARFSAASGAYQVSYGAGSPPPTPPPGTSGPFSLWANSIVPGVIDSGPDSALELGVRFRSDTSGTISAIRFYKASTNTGTHVGSLWSNTGTRLATATFTNETASGWQQVNFATPVVISSNTVYVASYHTDSGHYSFGKSYFAGSGVDSPPLHAPADGVSGLNGVYAYGAAGSFPNQSWNSSNYWIDVVFNSGASQVQIQTLSTPLQSLPSPAPTLLSISVTPYDQRIAVGATQQFTATGTYSDGSTQNLTNQVTWATSDVNLVAISTTGLVTAYNAGTVTITVTLDGITGSTNLTATDGVAGISSDLLEIRESILSGGYL